MVFFSLFKRVTHCFSYLFIKHNSFSELNRLHKNFRLASSIISSRNFDYQHQSFQLFLGRMTSCPCQIAGFSAKYCLQQQISFQSKNIQLNREITQELISFKIRHFACQLDVPHTLPDISVCRISITKSGLINMTLPDIRPNPRQF